MHCLSEVENAVLDYFMGEGDRVMCMFQCAEDLSGRFECNAVLLASELLLKLGLLSNAGDSTAYCKLSPATMGLVAGNYFTESSEASPAIKILQKRLVELEMEHTSAAEEASRLPKKGGLAKAPDKVK